MKTKKSSEVDKVIDAFEEEQVLINALENKSKEEHSKNAIFYFFIFGIILILTNKESFSSLWSLIAFFILGMFLAPILSIPSYLFKMFLAKRINGKQAAIIKNFYWILDLGYDFLVTRLIFRLFFGY